MRSRARTAKVWAEVDPSFEDLPPHLRAGTPGGGGLQVARGRGSESAEQGSWMPQD